MLDRMIQDAFDQMAGSDQPPARVSITHAIRRGRVQRRRHGLTAAGAPVFAAGAALAISLTGVIGLPARPPASGGAGVGTAAAPRYFNPLRPYAAFGWLPGGASERQSTGLFGQDELLISGPNRWQILLVVHADGRCQASGRSLNCNVDGGPAPGQVLGRMVGDVDRHPAYWAATGPLLRPLTDLQNPSRGGQHTSAGALAWQYARGGWAILQAPSLGDALRIARSVRFGQDVSPPVRFAFQLTSVPADWQVNAVATGWEDGVLYAMSYQITAGHVDAVPEGDYPPGTPYLETGPGGNGACTGLIYYGAHPAVINGFHVTLGGDKTLPPQAELCAADAEGLLVWITVDTRPTISPADLFAHHLRLLGPDPAHWTTQPIG
jgi:hypothetical protein